MSFKSELMDVWDPEGAPTRRAEAERKWQERVAREYASRPDLHGKHFRDASRRREFVFSETLLGMEGGLAELLRHWKVVD